MKDLIVRVINILIGAGLSGYVYFLFSNQLDIAVNPANNMISLVLVGIFALVVLVMGVHPFSYPRMKTTQTIAGIILVIFGATVLKDSAEKMVFLSDIVRVLGVILIITGPMGLTIPEKTKKKIQESKIEIIEV